MSNTLITGKVSFVNYDKKYVMIEYEQNNKKKTINGSIDDKILKNNKKHFFQIGDIIHFTAALSGRGDKIVASNIEYKYNEALDIIINKAKTQNSFIGYLKAVNDEFFVKEIDNYLFIPITISPWQIKPTEENYNEAISFFLENIDKKEKLTAKLFDNKYISEFYTAVKLHKEKTPILAEVYKVTPHGIYVNVIGNKIPAKIATDVSEKKAYKIGDKINVLITYFSTNKIIVVPVV